MTDRIKELAAEATLWCTEHAQGTPVAWEWEEKFAELIIKDCLLRVNEVTDWIYEYNHATVEKHVQKHFGTNP
jgi:hypothetical protein